MNILSLYYRYYFLSVFLLIIAPLHAQEDPPPAVWDSATLDPVVVSGSLYEQKKSKSTLAIESYSSSFLQKNPSPTFFESIGLINGVQPQLHCGVCNTGDIQINGMRGSYSLILIDGMPLVGGLSTVYGLSGIPSGMIERVEITKGPASTLYGSDALAGTINIITRNPKNAPLFNAHIYATSWLESNTDIATSFATGKHHHLLSFNHYQYNFPLDFNKDNFMDLTLQNRYSVFHKLQLNRKNNRIGQFAVRYLYEDRNGGEMSFVGKKHRGTEIYYGESIRTHRVELLSLYQLPVNGERVYVQGAYNFHHQNSFYGTNAYNALQHTGFGQIYWDKKINRHRLLSGTTLRYIYYDDNTPGTGKPLFNDQGQAITDAAGVTRYTNNPAITLLPGLFVQDEWNIHTQHQILLGYRYDYDTRMGKNGHVHSPRLAYKANLGKNSQLRAVLGTGYRVVSLFTEDHAALSGARKVVLKETLKPERAYSGLLDYNLQIATPHLFFKWNIGVFYTYFNNQIIGDFTRDPNKIIYENLLKDEYAITRGFYINAEAKFRIPLQINLGFTYTDLFSLQKDRADLEEDPDNPSAYAAALAALPLQKEALPFAPKWSAVFTLSYELPGDYDLDISGNINGPMRLPLLGADDTRPEYSPAYTLLNLKISKQFSNFLVYIGGKNLLNFVPRIGPLFRPFDPFDRNVGEDGIIAVAGDPDFGKKLTFDTEYNYAPLQGIRFFAGFIYSFSGKKKETLFKR